VPEVEPAGGLHGVGVQQGPGPGPHDSATGPRSVTVPTSLLTAMTLTTATSSPSAPRRASSRSLASTGTTVPPTCSTACSTAWCSAAGHGGHQALHRAGDGVVVGSVPHPVNTTSPGRQPMAPARRSRAWSTARLASRAKWCDPLGLAALGEERQHGRDGVVPHGRGRRVVEVDEPIQAPR
jgi:hypothetical protein